jgi:hypothetical protein
MQEMQSKKKEALNRINNKKSPADISQKPAEELHNMKMVMPKHQ